MKAHPSQTTENKCRGDDVVAQSCPALCDPMDCSLPGSSVHEILQARILEWVAIRVPRDFPKPQIKPVSLMSPILASGFFTINKVLKTTVQF